jgi:hypothetical protein
MERDCFGGTTTMMQKKWRYASKYAANRESYFEEATIPRISNALMLFYKRAQPPTAEEIAEEAEHVRQREIAAAAEEAAEAEAKRQKEALAAGDESGGAGGGAGGAGSPARAHRPSSRATGAPATKATETFDAEEKATSAAPLTSAADALAAADAADAAEGGLDEYEELLWSSNERAIRSVYALSP